MQDELTYIDPGVGIDGVSKEPVVLPTMPWGDGYQAIAEDVVY